MIRYLSGTAIAKEKNQLVLGVHGVGYGVHVTPTTLTSVALGDTITVYVSESIREDAHDLYGFQRVEERDAFELLRKVSGVGPKAAMAIIGFYGAGELAGVVESSDEAKLSLVPGVGKKMAGKIILELKGKMQSSDGALGGADPDLIAALESLGYARAEIARILPKIPTTLLTTNERITWVLRQFAE